MIKKIKKQSLQTLFEFDTFQKSPKTNKVLTPVASLYSLGPINENPVDPKNKWKGAKMVPQSALHLSMFTVRWWEQDVTEGGEMMRSIELGKPPDNVDSRCDDALNPSWPEELWTSPGSSERYPVFCPMSPIFLEPRMCSLHKHSAFVVIWFSQRHRAIQQTQAELSTRTHSEVIYR